MRFCRDTEQDGWFWIDQEIDGKADHLKPCPPCTESLAAAESAGRLWFKGELCDDCSHWLEIFNAIDDLIDDRPIIHNPVRDPVVLSEDGVLPERISEPMRDPTNPYINDDFER